MKNNWRCEIIYNNQTKQTFYFDTEQEAIEFSNDMLRWKKQLGISFTAIQNYLSFLGATIRMEQKIAELQIYSKYNAGPQYLNRGKQFIDAYKEYLKRMAEDREWRHFLSV